MNNWAILQKILLFGNIFLYFSRIYIKIMYICRRKLYSNNMQVFFSIYSIGVSLATGRWPFGVALNSAMKSSSEHFHRLVETLKLALDKSTSLWKRSKLLWTNPQACGNAQTCFGQIHKLVEKLKTALDKSTSLWKRSKLLWINPQACGNIENPFLTSNSYNYGKVFKT